MKRILKSKKAVLGLLTALSLSAFGCGKQNQDTEPKEIVLETTEETNDDAFTIEEAETKKDNEASSTENKDSVYKDIVLQYRETYNDYYTSSQNFECTKFYMTLHGNIDTDVKEFNQALEYYSENKGDWSEGFGLYLENTLLYNLNNPQIDWSKIECIDLSLDDGKICTQEYAIDFTKFPNLRYIKFDLETIANLDQDSLNSLISVVAKNNGEVYFHGKLTNEVKEKLQNIDMSNAGILNTFNVGNETYEKVNLTNYKNILATNIGIFLNNEPVEEPITLNASTQNVYVSGVFGENFKIDSTTPLNLEIYCSCNNEDYIIDTTFTFPESSTIKMTGVNALLSEKSLDSLRRYEGTYNEVNFNDVENSNEIINNINTNSPYLHVERNKGKVTLTIDINDDLFANDPDYLKFYYLCSDIRKMNSCSYDNVCDVTINYNCHEDHNLKDHCLPCTIGNLTLNLNTENLDVLNLLTSEHYASLTINNYGDANLSDDSLLKQILSYNINSNVGIATINSESPVDLDIEYKPFVPYGDSSVEDYYTLYINDKSYVIKEDCHYLIENGEQKEILDENKVKALR